jgi:HPr kinase/phosphorylase
VKAIAVAEMYQDSQFGMGLRLVAGKAGLDRKVGSLMIQKLGLALAGHNELLHPDRVQVAGYSEISYLCSLPAADKQKAVDELYARNICCLVVTKGQQIPPPLVDAAEDKGIPLFITDLLSSVFINRLSQFLTEKLAESTTVHGVLVDIHGVGTLLIGKSGIGKSECALDLIMRGHQLIADDAVEIKKKGANLLVGRSPELIKHHLEIRGLGIINIRELFGVTAVCDERPVDMVIELIEEDTQHWDRLGAEVKSYSLLGREIPLFSVAVKPGRSITPAVEIGARNFLLLAGGRSSRTEMEERVRAAILSEERRHEA